MEVERGDMLDRENAPSPELIPADPRRRSSRGRPARSIEEEVLREARPYMLALQRYRNQLVALEQENNNLRTDYQRIANTNMVGTRQATSILQMFDSSRLRDRGFVSNRTS